MADTSGDVPDVDADGPQLERSRESEHFRIAWTNQSPLPADNILDDQLIQETERLLEESWSALTAGFGRAPYVPPRKSKIDVVFRDLNAYGDSDPPDGPIRLNASAWQSFGGIRAPTVIHELFHKLQYAFGYRTRWPTRDGDGWFSEGTASFVEAFFLRRVSDATKLTDAFDQPYRSLWRLDYGAAPFWMFIDKTFATAGNPVLRRFLVDYEGMGDAKLSLRRTLAQVLDAPLPEVVADFALSRLDLKQWRDEQITGPDGKAIDLELMIDNVPLQNGAEYRQAVGLQELGSSYVRFRTDALPRGSGITVRANATDGTIVCRLAQMQGDNVIATSPLLPEAPHRQPVEVGVDIVLVLVGIDPTNSCDIVVSVA